MNVPRKLTILVIHFLKLPLKKMENSTFLNCAQLQMIGNFKMFWERHSQVRRSWKTLY